jgi:mRNA interferase RelE/StbE
MYSVEFSDVAKRQFSKLDHILKKRIVANLKRIRIRPYSHIKKLVGCPYFRLRVGNYRLILDIKDDKLIILVLELGHRKNIYKR